tara:strand:- start:386 stop:631 length:246 start_codon:yes stop_codon:yes gene_type:complete
VSIKESLKYKLEVPRSTSESVTGAITPSAKVTCDVPPAVNARVSAALKNKPALVSPVFVKEGEPAEPSARLTMPPTVTFCL